MLYLYKYQVLSRFKSSSIFKWAFICLLIFPQLFRLILNVVLNIPVGDLAYFDVETKKCVVEPGQYKLLAGSSLKDITQISPIVL